MLNNYMTEQYMTSVLQQYQHKSPNCSPIKTPIQTQSNRQSMDQFYENEELKRRQLNESLFKNVDNSMFDRTDGPTDSNLINKPSIGLNTTNPIHAMTRQPLLTSDSFRKPEASVVLQMSGSIRPQRTISESTVPSVRSSYFGQSLPQTRVRPLGNSYKARVIDYSNVKPKPNANRMAQTLRPNINSSSVLTERNVDPVLEFQKVVESVGALRTAIASKAQKQTINERPVMPKPILKNMVPNRTGSNSRFTRISHPNFDGLIQNTDKKQISVPKPKPAIVPNVRTLLEPKPTQLRDSLVPGFESQGIIRTTDMEKNETFYCYYCDNYIKKLNTVEKHCKNDAHKNNLNRSNLNTFHNPLNKKFILAQIRPDSKLESIGLKPETVLRMELDRIAIENRHYYYVKGIRLKNPGGPNIYHCNYCNKSIESLALIESHITSESHRQSEKRPTFMKFLSQITEPIVGLQFITEYMCPDLTQPVYECSLCKCFEEAFDMYLHVCSFKHKIYLLKHFNPNETILNSLSESPQTLKEIDRRIDYMHQIHGTGAILKINNTPKANKSNRTQASNYEIIEISDDEIDDTDDTTQLQKHLSVRVSNDDEAADTALVIQSLKESVVNYYLSKIPTQMRRVLVNKVMNND